MLREMDYIYAVYEERSFSKAAKKLYISQPALSNMVKKAEAEISAPIFDRSTIPLTVTREGEYYIRAIKEIKGIQGNVFDYFEDLKNLDTGELCLGGSSYFCSFVFPEMIARFHRFYPNIVINLEENNIGELRKGLENGSIDLVLETAIREQEKTIQSYFYKNEQIILGVPSVFPVNAKLQPYQLSWEDISSGRFEEGGCPCVPLFEFRDVPFVKMKPGNDMYQRSSEICKNAGFEMKAAIYVDQVMTSMNIASAGTGALFIRADIIKHFPEDKRITYYKFDDPLSTRAINWSVKKGRYLSRAARQFMHIAGKGPKAV